MNEEIPYYPPGMVECIRDGARKNAALLRKMQGQSEGAKSEPAKPSSLERVVGPLPCPFCGVEAKEHDGDYVLVHTNECFFTQQYAQEMWLVGKRRVSIWNKRANDQAMRPEAT